MTDRIGAVGHSVGLYGPDQRGKRGTVRAKEHQPEIDKCGTYAGYQAHYKRGEKACGPCMHAQAVYVGQWRARSGRTLNAKVPYHVLGALLESASTELEEWVEDLLGDAVVTNALNRWQAHRQASDATG